MNDIENEPVHDDFDDFEDIAPNNPKTNQKSDLDELESIKSEENLSPTAKPGPNKQKNEYLNSFNKSLNDSGVKLDSKINTKKVTVKSPKIEEKKMDDSFDDNFADGSFDDRAFDTVKKSEINDESFLEKEKQTLKSGQLKNIGKSKNKENMKPSIINSKINQKQGTAVSTKKAEIKNAQPLLTPLSRKTVIEKRASTKKSVVDSKKTNVRQSENNIVESRPPVYKMSQMRTKAKPASKNEGFSLIAVAEENKKLFEDLKDVNDRLTTLIEEKGYQNQLEKIRDNNTEFKYRPLNVKITTFDKEVKNNEKIIEVLNRELNLYNDTAKKLDSTELLNDLNKRIATYNAKIKAAKGAIYQLQLDHKKNEAILKNRDLEDKKAFDFKKLMMELDTYMTKNTDLNEKISKMEVLKTDLIKEVDVAQNENLDIKKKLEERNLVNFDESLIQKHKNLLSIKKRWESHLIRHEKNIELKLSFAERDIDQHDKEIEEFQGKIASYEQALSQQAGSLKDEGVEANLDLYNFEFATKFVSQKDAKNKEEVKSAKGSVERKSRQSAKKIEAKIIKPQSRNTSLQKEPKAQFTTKTHKYDKIPTAKGNPTITEKQRHPADNVLDRKTNEKAIVNESSKTPAEPLLKSNQDTANNKNWSNTKKLINTIQHIKTTTHTEVHKKDDAEPDVETKEHFLAKPQEEKIESKKLKLTQENNHNKTNDQKAMTMERKDSLDDILGTTDVKHDPSKIEKQKTQEKKVASPLKDTLDVSLAKKEVEKSTKKTEHDDDFDFLD